jgi:hypothetical protein
MKRSILIVALTLMAAVAAFAQAKPADPMPTVDQVLEKYVKAIGGKDAVMKVTSRVTKGTFDLAAVGVSGAPLEIYAKAPNKSYLVIDIAGFGQVQQRFNGTVAWSQDPQSGLREKTGVELAETKRDEDFHRDLKLKEIYPKLEVKGVEAVGGRDAYVVVGTPAEGSPDKMYFDKENGLMVRLDAERESPMGRAAIQNFMSDYKVVDGVNIPHTMKQVSPMGEFVIKLVEIKHNVPVEDAKFNKPASQ